MPVWVMPPLLVRLKEPRNKTDKTVVSRGRSRLIELLPGTVLILLGILFIVTYYGFLGGEWWQYFVVGLGLLIIIETWIQFRSSTRRRFRVLSIISGGILLIGGFLFLFNPNWWWPIVMMGIGCVLILLVLIMKKDITGEPYFYGSDPQPEFPVRNTAEVQIRDINEALTGVNPGDQPDNNGEKRPEVQNDLQIANSAKEQTAKSED